MAKNIERIFIRNARLSFPALDEKKPVMKGDPKEKYQATFIIEKDNPCVKDIVEATRRIAHAEFKDKARAVLANATRLPLKDGNLRTTPGYEDKLYVNAKSDYPPDLVDANPKRKITDPKEIRDKFQAGYRVNAYVDLFPYTHTTGNGISASLVSVQFAAYDEAFSGVTTPDASAYPDCSEQAAASADMGKAPARADTSFNPCDYGDNDALYEHALEYCDADILY